MAQRLRVVFMGTPGFSVGALEAIALRHEVIAVYTQPDRPVGRGLELQAPPVKVAAQKLGIPVFQPEKVSAADVRTVAESLGGLPDAVVVVAYGQLLKPDLLALPRLGCINIHASLLPRWRGAAPIQWSILAGDAETGVTTMQMDVGLDTGAMLLTERTAITADDTAQTLHDRLAELGARLILPTLDGLAAGTLVAKPQPLEGVTHAAKLTKAMEWLSPLKSARELDLQRRALYPWPGTRIRLADGQAMKIKEARLATDVASRPGEIFERAGRVYLGAAAGALELVRIQWDGKREISMGELVNGLKGRGLSLPLRWVSDNLPGQ